jgi:hypothetical protein
MIIYALKTLTDFQCKPKNGYGRALFRGRIKLQRWACNKLLTIFI